MRISSCSTVRRGAPRRADLLGWSSSACSSSAAPLGGGVLGLMSASRTRGTLRPRRLSGFLQACEEAFQLPFELACGHLFQPFVGLLVAFLDRLARWHLDLQGQVADPKA